MSQLPPTPKCGACSNIPSPHDRGTDDDGTFHDAFNFFRGFATNVPPETKVQVPARMLLELLENFRDVKRRLDTSAGALSNHRYTLNVSQLSIDRALTRLERTGFNATKIWCNAYRYSMKKIDNTDAELVAFVDERSGDIREDLWLEGVLGITFPGNGVSQSNKGLNSQALVLASPRSAAASEAEETTDRETFLNYSAAGKNDEAMHLADAPTDSRALVPLEPSDLQDLPANFHQVVSKGILHGITGRISTDVQDPSEKSANPAFSVDPSREGVSAIKIEKAVQAMNKRPTQAREAAPKGISRRAPPAPVKAHQAPKAIDTERTWHVESNAHKAYMAGQGVSFPKTQITGRSTAPPPSNGGAKWDLNTPLKLPKKSENTKEPWASFGYKYRCVSIYNVPQSVKLNKTYSMIRGGTIERIIIHRDQVVTRISVHFVDPGAAEAYYLWMKAAPFTVGGREARVDRQSVHVLSGITKFEYTRPGVSRIILVKPNDDEIQECGDVATETLKGNYRTKSGKIAGSFFVNKAGDRAFRLTFTSLGAALDAKKHLGSRGWDVEFDVDVCAGPLSELRKDRAFVVEN